MLAQEVEKVAIKRLNQHRKMRRMLGFFIMILYYTANLYYCISFLTVFNDETNADWALAFFFAVIFEFFVIELGLIFVQIEAVNYLKVGGEQIIETFCKFIINEDFLRTFD